MRANPDVYSPFFVGGYEAHVAATEKNDDYGTELEVAALAYELGRLVRVWQGYTKVSRGSHLAYRYISITVLLIDVALRSRLCRAAAREGLLGAFISMTPDR